ncbi:MAG: NAD(P)-binding protein, partial [Verrucomicrobiae bacterium]|nr:NAD(P)-binding protein [Verrucomicrobiae bacterium]
MGRRTAVIIGGGLGGLGTAIRLASAGFAVTILEKNASTGGKVSRFEKDGFTWDTGPSLITMPHVIEELFSSAGRNVSDYLTLLPVSPTCRYFWSDGKIINEDEDFFGRPDVEKFM